METETNSERQYISNLFRTAFASYKDKKIVLYGLAYGTEIIVNECKEFNILGLMDGFQKSGSMYGKNILSDDEVVEKGIELIVIIARANSTKIIEKRIEKFCFKNSIQIFDMRGNNLIRKRDKFSNDNPYFNVSYESLIKEIDKHEVISFDIFDTLLVRRALYPDDVFEYVERIVDVSGFAEKRIAAEREANRRYKAPKLDQIYELMVEERNLDTTSAERCKAAEFDYEAWCLIPREDMVKAFKHAVESGKRVYIISDMYLPGSFVEKILNRAGVTGCRGLLISCEYGKTKSSGLFDVVDEDHGSWLHIGDGIDSDIMPTDQLGIDNFRVFSSVDMLDISLYKDAIGTYNNMTEKAIAGVMLSKVFNSPLVLHRMSGRAVVDNGYDFGYIFIGPVLAGFTAWLIEKCSEDNIDCLLLVARDGYLIEKLLDVVKDSYPGIKLPEYLYFYTSRLAAVSATIKNDDDLKYAAEIAYSGKPEDLLRERFLLGSDEIQEHKADEPVLDYVFRHKDVIFKRSEELRKNYFKYIEATGVKKYSRYATIDHVSSGTCQMCLEELLEARIKGYYFIHYNDEYEKKQRLDTEGYFDNGFLPGLTSYYSKNYLPVESIIVSPEPTLKCFDETGLPLFTVDKRSDAELAYISTVQEGVINFWKDFLHTVGGNVEHICHFYVDDIYGLIRESFTKIENCVLTDEVSRNEYCGTEYTMDWMFE